MFFLADKTAETPANTAEIVFPIFAIPSNISINFPPASIAPLRKSELNTSFASSSNFAFVKSIEAWTDFAYSSFSSRAEPSACVASS